MLSTALKQSSRRPLVVANWKMNGNSQSNTELLFQFKRLWNGVHRAEVAICAPDVYLYQVAEILADSNVSSGAQDVSHYQSGAYTGETSASMLVDVGCHYVIIGHSERRDYFSEDSALVAEKFIQAQSAGLIPIFCVGESLACREQGAALEAIGQQLSTVVDAVGMNAFKQAVVAYEPIWAVGTGCIATPEQVQEVHHFIRERLVPVGDSLRILYGGSVKPANAAQIFALPDVDGALIGGASLNANDFYAICQAAEL